jgi:hypothetical protein
MPDWKPVFSDDFPAAADVDRLKWESPHYTANDNQAFMGRTGIRNPKDFIDSYRELGFIPSHCRQDSKPRRGHEEIVHEMR